MLEYVRNGRLAERRAPWCSFLEVLIHDGVGFCTDPFSWRHRHYLALYLYSASKSNKYTSSLRWTWMKLWLLFPVECPIWDEQKSVHFPQEKLMQHCGISANTFLSTFWCSWSILSKNIPWSSSPNSFFHFLFTPRKYHWYHQKSWIIANLKFLAS